MDNVRKLAKLLAVDTDWLLTGRHGTQRAATRHPTSHQSDEQAFLAKLITLQKEYRSLDKKTKAEVEAYLKAFPELQKLLGGDKRQ